MEDQHNHDMPAEPPPLHRDFFETSLSLNPGNASAWFELGQLLDEGTTTRPIHHYSYNRQECIEMCLRIDPQHAGAWYVLGMCLGSTGVTRVLKDTSLARQDCFERCLQSKPADAAAWYNLGVCIPLNGMTNSRIGDKFYSKHECFVEALVLDDSDALCWFNLGVCLPIGRESDPIRGVSYRPLQCFEEAIRRNPMDSEFWFNLGVALEADGLSSELKDGKRFSKQQAFELALRLDIKSTMAWYNLGALMLSRGIPVSHDISGRRYTAQACFEEAARLDPRSAATWFNLGLSMPKYVDEQIAHGNSPVLRSPVVSEAPTLPASNAHNGARVLCKTQPILGKLYTKEQCFEISLRMDRTYACAWSELGMLLEPGRHSSDLDGSGKRYSRQRCFEMALQLDLNDATSWYHLALSLPPDPRDGRSGDIAGKRYTRKECFEQALLLDPHMARAWNELGHVLSERAFSCDIRGVRYSKQLCFEEALNLDPGIASAWYNLALCLADVASFTDPDVPTSSLLSREIDKRRYTRRACLERALCIDDTIAEAWLQLGIALPSAPDSAQVAIGKNAGPLFPSNTMQASPLKHLHSHGSPTGSPTSQQRDVCVSVIKKVSYNKQQCFERALQLGTLEAALDADAWDRLGMCLASSSTSAADGNSVYTQQECFEMSIRIAPDAALAWFHLGVSLPRGGLTHPLAGATRYSEVGCFERSLTLDDSNPAAWFNLGLCLDDVHEGHDEAGAVHFAVVKGQRFSKEACFLSAIERERSDPDAWHQLGLCLWRRQRGTVTRLADENELGSMAAVTPQESPPKAHTATALGRPWSAKQCFEAALHISRLRHANSWVDLGVVLKYERPSDAVDVDATWGEAIAGGRSKGPVPSLLVLSVVNRSVAAFVDPPPAVAVTDPILGRMFTERECYENALLRNPQLSRAWYGLGSVLAAGSCTDDIGGKIYSERECFEQVLRLEHLEHADAWYSTGVLLPGDAETTNSILGRVYTQQECFEHALRCNPQHHEAWYGLGMLLASRKGLDHSATARIPTTTRQALLVSNSNADDISFPDVGGASDGEEEDDLLRFGGIVGTLQHALSRFTSGDQRIEAQDCFEMAVRIQPRDGKSWCELGKLLPEHVSTADIRGVRYSKAECFQMALREKYLSHPSNVFV